MADVEAAKKAVKQQPAPSTPTPKTENGIIFFSPFLVVSQILGKFSSEFHNDLLLVFLLWNHMLQLQIHP